MTVKTGTAWAGAFVTLDATGALEAGTPSGVLYVDGVADAATVTITGSNPYKWSVTLPSLTAGQRVDMYITATISTIATAGFVASEQVDTALVSEVKAETASILEDTGTTIPGTITTIDNEIAVIDGIVDNILEDTGTTLDTKINTIDDFLDTEVAAILADTNELQTDLTNGGRLDLLIDAIKAKTDTITTPPTAASVADAVWDEAIADHTTATTFGGKNQKVVPSETINDYKADVSALTNVTLAATQTGVTIPTVTTVTNGVSLADNAITDAKIANDAITYQKIANSAITGSKLGTGAITEYTISTGAFTANKFASDAISASKISTDAVTKIQTGLATPTNITAGTITTVTNLTNAPTNGDFTATMKSSITTAASSATPALSATGIDAILDEIVVGTYTMRQILKLMAAKMHGKATGGGTTSIKYTGLDNVADVIIETVDTNGNRSAVSLTV